jgi:hypothetical protein
MDEMEMDRQRYIHMAVDPMEAVAVMNDSKMTERMCRSRGLLQGPMRKRLAMEMAGIMPTAAMHTQLTAYGRNQPLDDFCLVLIVIQSLIYSLIVYLQYH